MSEQQGEKTEQATPKKIQDARKKGQVGQSPDISRLLICVVIFETMLALVGYGMETLQQLVEHPIHLISQPFEQALIAVMSYSFEVLVILSILVIVPAVIMGILGGWLQIGILFAPQALRMDIARLNPVSSIKQMFGPEKLVELVTNLIKAFIISLVIFLVVKLWMAEILLIPQLHLDALYQFMATVFAVVERTCLLVLLVLSLVDFAIKRFFYLKQLRMTKDEVKREYKDQEGDPFIKRQRRAIASELSMEPIPTDNTLDKANAVVVNPTHYAVALYYSSDETPIPLVMLKGKGDDAKEIIEKALEKQIPVIRYIWLARTLYRLEEGSFISRETLKPVALVYKMIKELEEEELQEQLQGEVINFPEDEM